MTANLKEQQWMHAWNYLPGMKGFWDIHTVVTKGKG